MPVPQFCHSGYGVEACVLSQSVRNDFHGAPEEGVLEQALTFHSRFHHLKCLPSNVLLGLLTRKYKVGVFPDLEEIIRRMSLDSECDHHVAQSIKHIVHKSSLSQTAKGFFTAGLHKSLRYSSQKVWKKLNTKKR